MAGIEKVVWILAGGNGAGKSTFYRKFLETKGVEFVNADLIEKEIGTDSYKAAEEAMDRFRQRIQQGISFCYETVFSHESKLDMMEQASDAGFTVNLVCIHIDDGLNQLRVQQRVDEGGHDVNPEKIVTRIPRTLKHFKKAVLIADNSLLFDNSSADKPFVLVASKRGEITSYKTNDPPCWATDILS